MRHLTAFIRTFQQCRSVPQWLPLSKQFKRP
jgi:hypothetical protein